MLPQLDSNFYISQLFWLVICFLILIFAFKKVFIPRMDSIMSKREELIKTGTSQIADLELQVSALKKDVESLKNEEIARTAEIIKEPILKAKKILDDQMNILKEENESLIQGERKKFRNEMNSLNSSFKFQIDITSQILLDKLFSENGNV